MKTVCDTDCFATTVENMFHVSFLIKKKELAISEDRHGILWLVNIGIVENQLKKRQRMDDSGNNRLDKDLVPVQTILNMCMKDWKDFSDCFLEQDPEFKCYVRPL